MKQGWRNRFKAVLQSLRRDSGSLRAMAAYPGRDSGTLRSDAAGLRRDSGTLRSNGRIPAEGFRNPPEGFRMPPQVWNNRFKAVVAPLWFDDQNPPELWPHASHPLPTLPR